MKQSKKIRVPYAFSKHGQKEIDAVVKVLKSNTALGDKTKEFENKIARFFGKKYGVMVNSGSSANLLALEILNLPKGSEIITPILTFATTVAPIVQKGLVPVFVDVKMDTFLIDINRIEKAITRKTRALMIPSLLGNIPDMYRLRKIARKYNLWFIEDSCDTLGARYGGKRTGIYSDISTTSFYGSHIINGAGGGGMVCVNNDRWRERLVILRGWGRRSSLFGEKQFSENIENRFRTKLMGVPYDEKFIFSEIGYNFLPLEISSAFALVQLQNFKGFVRLRRQYFKRLYNFFKKFEDFFILPKQTTAAATVWLAFPLIIKKNAPFLRHEIVMFLEKANIQTRPVFTGNILQQPGFGDIVRRLLPGGYPNTEYIMRNAFVIGCHQGLINSQLDYLELKFREFLGRF